MVKRLFHGVWVLFVLMFLASSICFAESVGAVNSKLRPAQTVYECFKTDEKITLDGNFEENAWRRASVMQFVGICDGSKPPFITEGKMIWDENYLYVAFSFEEPDIRAYWGMKDANCNEKFKEAALKNSNHPGWDYTECAVMRIDRFAKVFLDPDGDGQNYIELQINPLNNVFDSWYKQGAIKGQGNRSRFPNVEWKCPGLLSATRIDGTVNASQDVDKGWNLEIAIPWKTLEPLTKGKCPPVDGDIWGGHLGRVHRDAIGSVNEYWVWPFLEITDCHLPDRYGKVIFKDTVPKFERFFAWSAKDDEDFMKKASDIGVTDMMCGTPSQKLIELSSKYKIKIYPVITLSAGEWKKKYPDIPAPLQKMTETQEKMLAILNGTASTHVDEKMREGWSSEPQDYELTEKQKKLMAEMKKTNQKLEVHYQWGGEPEKKHLTRENLGDVLFTELLCINHPEVKEFLNGRIKEFLAVDGIKGIAFDFIGYQNYHDCNCELCTKLYNEFCLAKRLKPGLGARKEFFLGKLVDFNNELVDYVHSIKPDAVTVNHIYPVYLPEPLYGNRLKVDFCGQTAAWYCYWDLWKIQKYSHIITREQNKYWPNVKGVAFIGYYDKPLQFPVKSPEKVEAELRAILRGGSRMIMMCGLNDLLNKPDVAEVFRKFCKTKDN